MREWTRTRIMVVTCVLAGVACRGEVTHRPPGPPAGDPAGGDFTSADPSSGDPTLGDPSSGDPVAGDAAFGDSGAGDVEPSDGASGDPAPGDATSSCVTGGCAVGEFCDRDQVCRTPAQACSIAGCHCTIVGVGSADPALEPTLRLAPGASWTVEVILSVDGGDQVPTPSVALALEGGAPPSFTLSGETLTATSTTGLATLTADVDGLASCAASLVNLGAPPGGQIVRILTIEALSGRPAPSVRIMVDLDGDGTDDGNANLTSSEGITFADLGTATSYDVSAFSLFYDYVSVVGVPASVNDIVLPMLAWSSVPRTAGFTGRLDYTRYEEEVLGGSLAPHRLSFVTAAMPLGHYVDPGLNLLWGRTTTADCTSSPTPAGCILVNMSGLVDNQFRAWPFGLEWRPMTYALRP